MLNYIFHFPLKKVHEADQVPVNLESSFEFEDDGAEAEEDGLESGGTSEASLPAPRREASCVPVWGEGMRWWLVAVYRPRSLSFFFAEYRARRWFASWEAMDGCGRGVGRESENVLVLSRVGTLLPPPPKMCLSEWWPATEGSFVLRDSRRIETCCSS